MSLRHLFFFILINRLSVLNCSQVQNENESKPEASQIISSLNFEESLVTNVHNCDYALEFLIRVNLSIAFYLSKLIKIYGDSSIKEVYSLLEDIDQSIETNLIISQNQFLMEKVRLNKLFNSLSSFTNIQNVDLLENAFRKSIKCLVVEIDLLFETIINMVEKNMLLAEAISLRGASKNLSLITQALVSLMPKILDSCSSSIKKYRMDKNRLDKELASSLDRPELFLNTLICDSDSIKEREVSSDMFYKVSDYKRYIQGDKSALSEEEVSLVSEYFLMYHDTSLSNEELLFTETLFSTLISMAYFLCFNMLKFNHPGRSKCVADIFSLNSEFEEIVSRRGTNHIVDISTVIKIRIDVQSILKIEFIRGFDITALSIKDSLTKTQLLDLSRSAYKTLLDSIKLLKEYEETSSKAMYLKKLYTIASDALDISSKLILSNMRQINERSSESSLIPARIIIKEETSEEKAQRILQRIGLHLQAERAGQEKKKKHKSRRKPKYPLVTEEQARRLEEPRDRDADESAQGGIRESKTSKSKSARRSEKAQKLQREAEESIEKEKIKLIKTATRLEGASGKKRRFLEKKSKHENDKERERAEREMRMQQTPEARAALEYQGEHRPDYLGFMLESIQALEGLADGETNLNLLALISSVKTMVQENLEISVSDSDEVSSSHEKLEVLGVVGYSAQAPGHFPESTPGETPESFCSPSTSRGPHREAGLSAYSVQDVASSLRHTGTPRGRSKTRVRSSSGDSRQEITKGIKGTEKPLIYYARSNSVPALKSSSGSRITPKTRSKSVSDFRSGSRSRSRSRSISRPRSRSMSRPRSRSMSRSRPRPRSRSSSSSDSDTSLMSYEQGYLGATAVSQTEYVPRSHSASQSRFLTKFRPESLLKSQESFSVRMFFDVKSPDYSHVTDYSSLGEVLESLENCFKEMYRLHNNVCSLLSGRDLRLIKGVENQYIKSFISLVSLYSKKSKRETSK